MKPSVCNVGYLGKQYLDLYQKDKKFTNMMRKRWTNMINRCYNKENTNYKNYGAKGVKISDDWHNFSNYLNDIQLLPNYDRDKVISGELTLDKDFLQRGLPKDKMLYSKDTCLWLTRKDQIKEIDFFKIDRENAIRLAKKRYSKYFVVKDRFGNEHTEFNISEYARINGLNQSNISRCILGKRKSYKGYQFREAKEDEIKIYKSMNS